MATITEFKSYNNEKSFNVQYIVHDGEFKNFVIDEDWGFVEVFTTLEKAEAALLAPLGTPFGNVENYDIVELNGKYMIVDDHFEALWECDDIWPIIAKGKKMDRMMFPVFIFDDNESDQSDDYDDYDLRNWNDAPSFYHGAYDGPRNYVPMGSH